MTTMCCPDKSNPDSIPRDHVNSEPGLDVDVFMTGSVNSRDLNT